MKVAELHFDPKWVTGPAEQLGLVRSSATLHLSQIYHDLEESASPREPMDEQQMNLYRAGGFVWEQVLHVGFIHSNLSARYVRPGEVMVDGIVGSPDLLDLDTGAVVDSKFTWRSMRKLDNIEKWFWIWLVQLKGYCRMVGTNKAELWVFFACGDWAPPVPRIRRLGLEFSDQEIKENWDMLVEHARRRGWL